MPDSVQENSVIEIYGNNAPPQAAPRKNVMHENGNRSEVDQSEELLDDNNPFKDDIVSRSSGTGESTDDMLEEPIYARINPETKSPKKGLYSDVPPAPLRTRGTMEESAESFDEMSNNDSRISSYTDDSRQRLIPSNNSGGSSVNITGENRFWPKVRYAIKKKEITIPMVSATIITLPLAIYAAYAYLQNHAKFIAFITNSPKFITIPGAIALSLFVIGAACAINRFNNTREYQIQGESANEILEKVLECQSNKKIIKSVLLEYTNGTHSKFMFNVWESKNNIINVDEKVINRASRIGSVINDRPLPIMLLTGVIVANVVIPLSLYAIGGINSVQLFYQNILANNIGLSVVIGSAILAVSALCLYVHYYNKTNCANLGHFQEEDRGIIEKDENIISINKKLVDEIKRERINVLGENHSKDPKCKSLTLEQVIVQSHNFPEAVYTIG